MNDGVQKKWAWVETLARFNPYPMKTELKIQPCFHKCNIFFDL